MAGDLVPWKGSQKKSKRGRKEKLADEKTAEQFFECIRQGLSEKDAADYCGISLGAVARSKRNNVNFVTMLRAARAFGKMELLTIITRAAKGDWRAAAWKLSRWFPDEWSDRKPNILTADKFQAAIASIAAVILRDLPPKQAKEKAAQIQALLAAVVEKRGL